MTSFDLESLSSFMNDCDSGFLKFGNFVQFCLNHSVINVCSVLCDAEMVDLSTLSPAEITVMGSVFCVLLSMHFTMQLISQHLFYWKNPKQQRAILFIVLMAPVYAVSSFLGLLDAKGSKPLFMFLNAVKDCYEALVGY